MPCGLNWVVWRASSAGHSQCSWDNPQAGGCGQTLGPVHQAWFLVFPLTACLTPLQPFSPASRQVSTARGCQARGGQTETTPRLRGGLRHPGPPRPRRRCWQQPRRGTGWRRVLTSRQGNQSEFCGTRPRRPRVLVGGLQSPFPRRTLRAAQQRGWDRSGAGGLWRWALGLQSGSVPRPRSHALLPRKTTLVVPCRTRPA